MPSLSTQLRAFAFGVLHREPRAGWLQLPADRPSEAAVKPTPYLAIYERLLAPLRWRRFTLLELGVWGGHSLEMWRDAFPRATIIGVDLHPPELDLGPRVHIAAGDQSDPALMQRLRELHAPGGFDVIVDDASHMGVISARSLQVLYPEHLRPGGLYCIEDWGTGYLPDWHDGGRLDERIDLADLDSSESPIQSGSPHPVLMPSHAVGMVGLTKRLVDHTARKTAAWAQPEAVGEGLEIDTMTVWDGVVALRKPLPG
jgi:hypothetical protein